MKNVPIIFENADYIVLNKPAGLAVQGGAGITVSVDSLLAMERDPRPLLVHRLDKETSGLLLVAKHKQAAADFSRFLGAGGVSKYYRALCAGTTDHDSGCIRIPLDIRGTLKKAETSYRLLAAGGGYSLLELELGTGRMHQIRRHLAQTGTPIIGDDRYGDFSLNKQLKIRKLLLYAARILIPEIALDVSVEAPPFFSTSFEKLLTTMSAIQI
ncbi:RNA pseudouridine synthase [Spirochaetia bacterium]|nr:RNA pseudouridine synthase [Spirochaetia bacterium]GHU29544.1 RNA pseudouridine synthase [Spirochaetia bacterium]